MSAAPMRASRRPRTADAAARVAALLLPLALAGCAVAPTTVPAPEMPAAFSATAQASFDDAWWRSLDDPVLEALVAEAARGNPDWRIALSRVEQARAGLRASATRLMPTVSAGASASEQRSGLPDDFKRGQPDVRALRGAIDLSWEIDLFGAARAARDAAAFDAQAAEEGARAARLLATGEVARQYLAWQGARARRADLERLLRSLEETERLTRLRATAGQASGLDVARAAAELRSMAAQRPGLQAAEAAAEHQIALLLGASATQPVALLAPARQAAPRLPDAPILAPGQPVDLLLRRPDIAAAHRQLAADAARAREAGADRLPRLVLAALVGQQDLRINGLNLSPVPFGNAALALSMPLFNAGRLEALEMRAQAREQGARRQLERAALGALQEVESSLALLQAERERAVQVAALRDERQAALRHASALHREGQIDRLTVLDAQRGVIAAELEATEQRARIALGALQLYRALGGSWSIDPSSPASGATPSSRENPR
jgi:NodT family efflux transporter outer membrane factor (OMF) lipoprotein